MPKLKKGEDQVAKEQEQEVTKPKREIGPGAWEIPIPDGAELGGVPPGTYISKCIEEPKESVSSKGEPQTEFRFSIADPSYPEYEGREGGYWCSRKPKAWWNIIGTLDAMDVPYEIIRDEAGRPKTFRFDPMDCVNAMCKTVWTEQTFQGRTRSRINRIIGVMETVDEFAGEVAGEAGDNLPF